MRKVIVLAVVFCCVFSLSAQAKNLWDMAESNKYGEKAGGMFVRGILNAASCFVDMPVGAVKGAKSGSNQVMGAVGGFASGAMCTVLRAASGVLDVATFWIPAYNGMAPCRQYGDCLACYNKEKAVEPVAAMPAPSQAVVYQGPAPAPAPEPAPQGRMKYIKK